MASQRPELDDIARQLPPTKATGADGFHAKELLDETEKKIDEIEMIGEEVAAGFRPPEASQISPGMRYLHISRTIHQLVTDRNRAVGISAVAGLLWTASAAVMNAHEDPAYIIPLSVIKRWCMPFTFAVLTVLAVFMAFLLIRTRIGLIYEVAKMNVLLGLPLGRVKAIQPLSIFFIMQVAGQPRRRLFRGPPGGTASMVGRRVSPRDSVDTDWDGGFRRFGRALCADGEIHDIRRKTQASLAATRSGARLRAQTRAPLRVAAKRGTNPTSRPIGPEKPIPPTPAVASSPPPPASAWAATPWDSRHRGRPRA